MNVGPVVAVNQHGVLKATVPVGAEHVASAKVLGQVIVESVARKSALPQAQQSGELWDLGGGIDAAGRTFAVPCD